MKNRAAASLTLQSLHHIPNVRGGPPERIERSHGTLLPYHNLPSTQQNNYCTTFSGGHPHSTLPQLSLPPSPPLSYALSRNLISCCKASNEKAGFFSGPSECASPSVQSQAFFLSLSIEEGKRKNHLHRTLKHKECIWNMNAYYSYELLNSWVSK